MVIAAAIGILILGSIAEYSSSVGALRNASLAPSYNYSVQQPAYAQDPGMYASLQLDSVAYAPALAHITAYGCANGTARIIINSSSLTFSMPEITGDFYGYSTWTDGFYPQPGADEATVWYSLACAGKEYNGSIELYTVASYPGAQQAAYYAYISDRNESVVYNAVLQQVPALHVWTHCTYRNWQYDAYSEPDQCGSPSWEYLIYGNGSCADTYSVCIAPEPTGYNISSTGAQAAAYMYSFNLTIYDGVIARARLSSLNATAPLIAMGKDIGNASVVGVSGSGSAPGFAELVGPGGAYNANVSAITQYTQARNNLYGVLDYYNATMAQGEQAQIQQAISSYDAQENGLVYGAAGRGYYQCTASGRIFECRPQVPLYYVINVTGSAKYLQSNEVMDAAGSVVRVER